MLRVAAYELGEHVVPSIDVVAVGPDRRIHAIPTEPLSLKIKSLLANVPDPQPRPAASPVRVMERDLRPIWAAAAIMASHLTGATDWADRKQTLAAARQRSA